MSMRALEKAYLTALSENIPDTSPFGLSLFFYFGFEELLKARNRNVWATWLDSRIRSVLRLPVNNENYIRVQSFLKATENNISPLQVCLAYKNRVFYDMFVRLGCREDFLMKLDAREGEAPELISIERYARREGIWETA